MSDSDFSAVSRIQGFLGVMDPEWLTDTLSDDEVDLPEGHDLAMDDGEVDLGESMETAEKEENKWSDMGVDLMLQREGPTQPSTSNTP